jgi:multidrug efflux pump subunit AcrB
VVAAYTLQADKVVTHGDGPIMTRYLAALRWCVEHRWRTLAFGTVFFILSVLSMTFVEKSFIPAADMGSAQLSIELPSGVRLEDTAAVAAQAYHVLRQQPEVTDVVESIGTDETGEVRRATLFVSLVPRDEREVSQKDWERRVIKDLKRIPDARIDFSNQSGAGGGRDVNLYVVGSDPIELQRLYVDRSALGRGVGAALMRASLDTARLSGHRTLWLGVWERNTRAISFYEQWQFATVGKHKFSLGSDNQTDLIMARPVPGAA